MNSQNGGEDGDSPHVGPIIFENKTARSQLLDEGEVTTFRTSDRTTGETWARASRTGPKIADVTVKHDRSTEAPSPDVLAPFADLSGFGTAERWWDAILDVHGLPSEGHIYRVTVR